MSPSRYKSVNDSAGACMWVVFETGGVLWAPCTLVANQQFDNVPKSVIQARCLAIAAGHVHTSLQQQLKPAIGRHRPNPLAWQSSSCMLMQGDVVPGGQQDCQRAIPPPRVSEPTRFQIQSSSRLVAAIHSRRLFFGGKTTFAAQYLVHNLSIIQQYAYCNAYSNMHTAISAP